MNIHHQSAAEALSFAEDRTGSYIDPDTQSLWAAQAEATLALAYEQRTANLLAVHAALDTRREYRKALDVLKVINERLGL